MKTRLTLAVAIGSLVLAFGCSKQEEGVPSSQSSETASTGLVQKVTTTAKEQTEAAKETIQTTATNIQAQATDATTSKVQGIIDQAKKLMSENKMSEALTTLKGLDGQQLTPDQQTLVESLKAQIQKALDAAKSAGGLLPANK